MEKRTGKTNPCKSKPSVQDRPLLNDTKAGELEALFKILGNRTRLRMLHALVREGELCVTDLGKRIGMKPQATSNQLQRMVDRGVVSATRNGARIHYSVVDPCVAGLLDRGICLWEDAKKRKR